MCLLGVTVFSFHQCILSRGMGYFFHANPNLEILHTGIKVPLHWYVGGGINRIITIFAKLTNSIKTFCRRRLCRKPILLLLLVCSIPSTSDDYILFHAWTIYNQRLPGACIAHLDQSGFQ